MLQVLSAVQTLHTHSMVAHGRSIGAYNTPVATQLPLQHLCYSLVQFIGIWLFDRNSMEILLKVDQVLLAYIDLSTCTKRLQTYTRGGVKNSDPQC